MKNEIDPNSIPDFDEQDAEYQVWLFRYNDLDQIIDDEFISCHSSPDEAIARARDLVDDENEIASYFNDETAYVQVEVESVVTVEGWEENIGSLFNEFVVNKNF